MALLNEYAEVVEETPGQFRHTQHLKKIAYRENGSLLAMVQNWEDSGEPLRPHQVVRAPIMVTVGEDGMRRMHPTRELDRYVEIGAPFVKTGGVWGKVNLGTPTRAGSRLQWTRPQANMSVDFGGHRVKLGILLKGGFVPEDSQIAFPVGMQGFTRQGSQLLRDGIPISRLLPPFIYDAALLMSDTRPIESSFTNINGQAYWLMTLPDLAGIAQPFIDPTLDLQPDASTGKDGYMASGFTTFNNGTTIHLLVGERDDGTGTNRSLIQFNLTSIPSNATVTSATLSLYQWHERSSNIRTFRIYRMIRAWVEGTGAGSASGDGATWATYNGVSNWGTAGADNTTSDRESGDSGNRSMGTGETVNVFKDFTMTAAAVEAWISGAFANNGMLLKMDTETNDEHLFYSSDETTAANRPKFQVVYTVPAASSKFMFYQRLRRQ